jgi:hypothetical protein
MNRLNASFKEEQYINMWWFRLILAGSLAVVIWAVYETWGSTQLYENIGAAILFWGSLLIGTLIIIAVWFWKLTTHIDNYGITVKCLFINKKVNWDEIEHLEVLDYGFIGGWVVRIGTKYGTVYNTSGSKGMAVVLKNNKKFLIGIQKEQELKKIVEKWKNTSL